MLLFGYFRYILWINALQIPISVQLNMMLAHYNRQEHICAHNAAYSETFAPELLKEREGGDEKK